MTPDTLEFNNGDQLVVDMHDTPDGFQVVIRDLTTGESGSMTASVANGFGHALFQPDASTLHDGRLRVPPAVQHLQREHAQRLGGAHVQRRLLG